MSKLWNGLKSLTRRPTPQEQELNRSRYSLVSCGELTADTLQLWMDLPEEVKFDPSLAPIRQMYEKEHGKLDNDDSKRSTEKKNNILHLVKSAPVLTEEVQQLHCDEETEKSGTKDAEKVLVQGLQQQKETRFQFSQAKYFTKMTLLLACWLFFTVIFLTYNEKKEMIRHSSVAPGEVKNFILNKSDDQLTLLLTLSGPFLSEHAELKQNSSGHQFEAWLESWEFEDGSKLDGLHNQNVTVKERSDPWKLTLLDDNYLDFNEGEPRSSILHISSNITSKNTAYCIRLRTNLNRSIPFTMSYALDPLDVGSGVIYSCVLLFGLYVLIIFDVINRTMAAIVVSTMSLAVLSLAGERPTVPEVISWLDIETLVLLFSMMILVAIMAETGIFDFLAVATFEVTKGKLWPLIFLLGIITAALSTFLDNVTTILLMSPVTIRLCEVMDLDPVPILMFMAMYSNIGGTATPVGDPPNVIVASNKAVIQSGIHFTNFTAHMSLGIIFVLIQMTLQLRFMFRDTNKLRLNVPRDIQDIRHQISIWRRAAESLPHLSQGVHVVRERLEKKIKKLSTQLDILVRESKTRACPKNTFKSTLTELKDKYKIRDKKLLLKASVAIVFVVVVFFLHSIPELNRVSLGWTALLGAILLLILADRGDIEPILHRVEWSTLLFFAALFVLMEALSKLGLILYIGGLMEQLILKVDQSARLAVAIMLILWVSGLISGFVDNIPLTTMMVRVVVNIGSNPRLHLPLQPLIWALLFGACLGGNGTLIAASANVVCAGVAEQHGYKFTFMQFFRVGFPIVIGHLVTSSVYLLICHCVFEWH